MAESADLALRATRPRRTKHSWTDWEIAAALNPLTRATLQTIFEWRDARGRDKDQPPHFMLSDGLALDVARRRPKSLADLQANRRVPQGLIRRFGNEIINAVEHASVSSITPVYVPTSTEREIATALELWATIQSKTTGIAPKLAMPRRIALKIAHEGIDGLTGWRAEAFGEAVAALLAGKEGLFIGPDKTEIR
jgi:ribonuclease D